MFNGMMRGFQLIADFFHLLTWAIAEQNGPALQDCQTIAVTWLGEAKDTGLKIGLSPWTLLTSDPFRTSRTLLQQIEAKYGKSSGQ